MGKRGPQATPTKLRLVAGATPDQVNDDEPIPSDGELACPPEASDAVRQVWDYTVKELDFMRIITAADRDALYAYCNAVVTHKQATQILAAEGLITCGAQGQPMKNPAYQIQREAGQQMRHFAQEFGLTPSARAGIKVAPAGVSRSRSDRLFTAKKSS